jgi:hypothetical protein
MKKMKNLKLLYVLSFCFPTSLFSQTTDVTTLNRFRAGDEIIKQQMEYVSPGAAGRDIVWDFSRLNTIDDYYSLIYYNPTEEDTAHIVGWEHQTQYFYEQRNDSILMTGYNNRSVEMTFVYPELQMRFPLHYGDTLSAAFHGNGLYFQEMEMIASGRTHIKADATGTLIVPGQDTLKNVVRVKRLRVYDNIGVENASMRLETYNWYAPGYRYPVFESVRSTIITENVEKTDYSTAFYFPIAHMESLADDPENEAIRENIKQDQGVLLSCHVAPNPVDSNCTLSFELSVNAQVSIRLCNIVGFPISVAQQQQILPAGQHEKNISMSGLQKGNYVLYIQTNNYVTKQIVIKK